MTNTFKVALVQQNIIWGETAQNLNHISELISELNDVQLIVLPEMFSTGFEMSPKGVAECPPYPSLEWMKSISNQKQCAVAGSIAVEEDGKFYNRFYFVTPAGDVKSYDKRHLFSYSGEDKAYTHGTEKVIVEWQGVRFLLLVCYDMRFPVWIRYLDDYDAILVVANWPSSRRHAWDTLLAARAIENQCYVCGVNRVGTDPLCEYNGGTRIVNPYGEVICSAEDYKEGVIVATIDIEGLQQFRDKFPVLADADSFDIK